MITLMVTKYQLKIYLKGIESNCEVQKVKKLFLFDFLCSNNYILNNADKNAWEERITGYLSKTSCMMEIVQKFCIYFLPN